MATRKTNANNQIVTANYHHVEIPEHQGNPLIEALPVIGDVTDVIRTFGHYPEVQKGLSLWGRLQMIDLLDQNYFAPLPNHFEVIQQLFLSIPSGYVFRNPAQKNYSRALVNFYKKVSKGKLEPLYQWQPTNQHGFALFGCSGVGKTTVIERALSYFPKAYKHQKYKMNQVVWIKVDCPPDGSIKQFLLSVIREFDTILDSTYYAHYSHHATDGLIQAVAFLAAYHHLGILVIDEIQHLLDAKQHKNEILLNYLVTLNNVIHLPIVYVGTIRAMELCETAFRQARRVGAPFLWDRLPKSSDLWRQFLETLWEYQWCEPVELSEQLSETIYYYTQGIHALVVRLFQLAQVESLLNNKKISAEVVRHVARNRFTLVEPMLASLRHNADDPKTFWSSDKERKFEDLIYKTLATRPNCFEATAQSHLSKSREPEITNTLAALNKMGYATALCKETILTMFDENPNLDANKAVKLFLSSINSETSEIKSSSPLSLVQIGEEARASGKSVLQGLQEAGLSPKTRKTL